MEPVSDFLQSSQEGQGWPPRGDGPGRDPAARTPVHPLTKLSRWALFSALLPRECDGHTMEEIFSREKKDIL